MITRTYSSGVDGIKEYIFDCGRYKNTSRFNETQKELSNYTLQSSEKGGPDVAKIVHTLQKEDLKPAKPTDVDKQLTGLKKDVWMDNYQAKA